MRFLIALLMLSIGGSSVANAQLTYQFGLRQAGSDTLRPALEFNVRYELAQTDTDPRWHHFNYAVFTQGYQTFNRAIKDVDHMELGLSCSGRYYRNSLTPLAPIAQDYYVDLLERSEAAGGPGITAAQEHQLDSLVAKVREHRVYVGYSAYGRFVTDQQVRDKLVNLGFGIQAEIPLLGKLLDVPLASTRGTEPFPVQPVRASLSGEYVKGLGDRNDEFPRAFAEILWASRVFDRFYPHVRWQAEYSTRNPAAPHDFNNFLDLGVKLPMTSTASVVFKYLVGRTAPNYEKVNLAVLGLDVASW